MSHRYRAPSRRSSALERILSVVHRGSSRFCAVCKSAVRAFGPYGHTKRWDAKCPVCSSVERHRFTWAFFEEVTDLFDGMRKRMLHIAPEPAFERRLRALEYLDYITADQQDDKADVTMDITDIQYPDGSFDVIHCSHVLEHVQDDLRAMRELSRVLSPTGWATVLVPVIAEQTFEDPSVTDPKERARLFGQWDHVRAYGPDFRDRLASQGFSVEVVSAHDFDRDPASRARQQFKREDLYFCRKAAT
jgi:SAM-dependent methyltransferase